MRRGLAWFLDCGMAICASLIVLIALTGGGKLSLFGVSVSFRATDNPLAILTGLVLLRFALLEWAPILGVPSWTASKVSARAAERLRLYDHWSSRITSRQAWTILSALCVLTLALKVYFAWTSPGFFSGDDVEVQEMTLSAILGSHWPIWDLRSAVFPMGFVYPLQAVAFFSGIKDVGSLVSVGRTAVALLSAASLWLLWLIGRRIWPNERGYALLAPMMFGASKLYIAFGSSELPRPVSTVFVLVAFLACRVPGPAAVLVGGLFLSAAACLRFSEAVFVVPALVQLCVQRSWRRAIGLAVTFLVTAAAIVGVADWYYWGQPFHSLVAAIDFTLVKRLSSRGYQPFWWYLSSVGQWLTLPVFGLALVGSVAKSLGSRREQIVRDIRLWAFLPLLLLSALPHKEARYAIPLIPFVVALAAVGAFDIIRNHAQRRPSVAALLVVGLAVALLDDVTHYRLPRSNDDVTLFRAMLQSGGPPVIAVQQSWRVGGHLFLGERTLVDLDPANVGDLEYLKTRLDGVRWAFIDGRSGVTDTLLPRLGYKPVPVPTRSRYQLWESGS